MKRVLMMLMMLTTCLTIVEAQSAKEERAKLREERRQEQARLDSLFYLQSVKAIEEKSFVLEADRVIFKRGQTAYVSSNTNFVALDGDKATVQIAFNIPVSGPNGIGGITVDGTVSGYEQKTDKKVYIPLDRRVRMILDKYGGSLPRVSANEMNRLIKTVGLLFGWTWDCGFDARRLNPRRGRRFCDMLLSHTARRSFATNAYKAGVPLTSIQSITGHSSEAQLRRYLKLNAEEKAILALKDFKGVIEI